MGTIDAIKQAHKTFVKWDSIAWTDFGFIDWIKLPFVYFRAVALLTVQNLKNG